MDHIEYLRKIGAKGGAVRSQRKARTSEQARAAVAVRWAKAKRGQPTPPAQSAL